MRARSSLWTIRRMQSKTPGVLCLQAGTIKLLCCILVAVRFARRSNRVVRSVCSFVIVAVENASIHNICKCSDLQYLFA